MGVARIEEKVFIIKKESVRGTAEASASGGVSLPVLPASEVNFVPALIEDAKIFGDANERPAQRGIREGTGTLELEPGPDKIGELLLSLFGFVATDQPDAGGAPNVYRHHFTKLADSLHPLYTLFVDRQAHQKKYEGLMASQMTFNVPVDGPVGASADVIFKKELAGAVLTPSFTGDLNRLLFSDIAITLAGSGDSITRSAQVVIANNAIAKRVLASSQDAADVCSGALRVTGSFQRYFEDDTERAKFVGGTDTSLDILAEAEVLEGAIKSTLQIGLPKVQYDAGPVAEVDGILVQDFTFKAVLDPTAGYPVRVTLINKVVSY